MLYKINLFFFKGNWWM